MGFILFVSLIITILVLSGIVSGSEAALLSISYPKTKELSKCSSKKTKKKAKKLLHIKDNINKYLSTIVILNNIINIVGSVYVGVLTTKLFGEFYIGIVSGVLTFLIIIFAEIIPKIYGEKYSTEISLFIASPLILFSQVFAPILFIVENITNIFVKENTQNNVSEGEIKEMAVLGHKEGTIKSYESEMISNVFKMDDTEVYDIMIPKHKVVLISKKSTFNEIVEIIEKTGFTRFPVSNNGNIIGSINVKDLFKYHNRKDTFFVSKILRPVIYAPENMKIFALEDDLKKQRNHIAVVVNEHGDFTGIVTLEDIIEELLGEIEDEYDTKEMLIKKISNTIYHIDASISIDVLNSQFNLNLNLEDAEFSTLNGYLTSYMGRIPKVNDKVKLDNCKFRIIRANRKKVLEVELIMKN